MVIRKKPRNIGHASRQVRHDKDPSPLKSSRYRAVILKYTISRQPIGLDHMLYMYWFEFISTENSPNHFVVWELKLKQFTHSNILKKDKKSVTQITLIIPETIHIFVLVLTSNRVIEYMISNGVIGLVLP